MASELSGSNQRYRGADVWRVDHLERGLLTKPELVPEPDRVRVHVSRSARSHRLHLVKCWIVLFVAAGAAGAVASIIFAHA